MVRSPSESRMTAGKRLRHQCHCWVYPKKQRMQWSKKGAHLLLQTRTRTLDGTLHDLFTTWYPAMPANDVQPAPLAAAA
jgi:hypothetical protein